MTEIWKSIPEYEGLYEASNHGRIRSIKRSANSGRVLKPHVSKRNGYCYVSLCKDGKATTKRVHRLVYRAFNPGTELPKRYDKWLTLDHKDGDKTNNRIDNLELCSQSENQRRAFAKGLNPVFKRKVIDLTTGDIYDSVKAASISVSGGGSGAAVTRVCKGQRSQYRNHKFAYYEDYTSGTIPTFCGRAKRSCEKLWVR